MKVVIQRVKKSSVLVDNKVIGSISEGLNVLVGFGKEDHPLNFNSKLELDNKLNLAAKKILELRIFSSISTNINETTVASSGRFSASALDLQKEIILVPQFTLYANTSKGRKPDFNNALEPLEARKLFENFVEIVSTLSKAKVQTGEFGASMVVEIINDGPVTICLEV